METTYSQFELNEGYCSSCGEKSNEILEIDGRCLDCIEEEKFYHMTMNMMDSDGDIIGELSEE